MKQIELESRLAQIQAEYVEKKSSVELAITQHKVAIKKLRKECDAHVCEHKIAILDHEVTLSAMKAEMETRKAAVFAEFQRCGEQE